MASSLLLLICLCLIAGSAIDTGNVCIVRAAGDLVAGKPAIALGCLITLVFASAVFYLDTRMGWQQRTAIWAYPGVATIAGAVLFALGALVNGACAVGTIGRLARGDIGYAATLAGALAVGLIVRHTDVATHTPDQVAKSSLVWLVIIAAVSLPPVIAFRRHLRWQGVLSYAVLGLAAAVLTNLQGDWTWLSLMQEVRSGLPVGIMAAACVVAVVTGATLTALFRHRFRLIRPDPAVMLREALGGALMAAGTLMIPGANDALLIYGIPSGSPHAVAAYAVIFVLMILLLRISPLVRRWGYWRRA